MELEVAIAKLKQAKNIDDWNRIRENIKVQIRTDVWVRDFVPVIDASGLVVEVLGQD